MRIGIHLLGSSHLIWWQKQYIDCFKARVATQWCWCVSFKAAIVVGFMTIRHQRGHGSPSAWSYTYSGLPYLYRCTCTRGHPQPAGVVYNRNLLSTFLIKTQTLKFFFKNQNIWHLALFHPIFSIATITRSCRSQPSGSQPWLHNRRRAFSKVLLLETN